MNILNNTEIRKFASVCLLLLLAATLSTERHSIRKHAVGVQGAADSVKKRRRPSK